MLPTHSTGSGQATGAYLARRQPHFAAESTGRQALDAMGAAWDVPRCIWATLADGSIYWGDWSASPMATAGTVELDPRLVVERDPEARALELPCLPRVRPGVVVQDGPSTGSGQGFPFMVRRAVFAGATVRVEWGEVDG